MSKERTAAVYVAAGCAAAGAAYHTVAFVSHRLERRGIMADAAAARAEADLKVSAFRAAQEKRLASDPALKKAVEESWRARRTAEEEAAHYAAHGSAACEAAAVACGLRATDSHGAIADNRLAAAAAEAAAYAKGNGSKQQQQPFKGVCVSIKDSTNTVGMHTLAGCAINVRNPKATFNSALVDSLVTEGGAVVLCKGNAPQCLLMPESVNTVWGRACNPYNLARTTGGSSGGDAALVALGACHVGIGTDVGGSIRAPASFCGVVGFKPTPRRMTTAGNRDPKGRFAKGQNQIMSTSGPIARCVGDCAAVMRLWLSPVAQGGSLEKLVHADPYMPPVPWREAAYAGSGGEKKGKRIGYFEDDGWFAPCPTARRAVREAKAALEAAGHTLVPFVLPDPKEANMCYAALITGDGAMQGIRSEVGAEALAKEYSQLAFFANVPFGLRKAVSFLLENVAGQPRAAACIASAGGKPTSETWLWIRRAALWKEAVHAKMQDGGLEALLCPTFPIPPFPHSGSSGLLACVSYCSYFNLLHWPAGSVPVAVVKENECTYEDSRTDVWVGKAAASMKGAAGMPVGVQIATMPYQDELCLRLMKDVEKVCGPTAPPPSVFG